MNGGYWGKSNSLLKRSFSHVIHLSVPWANLEVSYTEEPSTECKIENCWHKGVNGKKISLTNKMIEQYMLSSQN